MAPEGWAALIGAMAALVTAGIAFVIFWMTLGSRIAAAETRAEGASTLAVAAEGKAQLLATEFANHRESVARDIGRMEATILAASSNIVSAEKRLTDALEDVAGRVNGVSERIDKLIQTFAGKS